jgi:hypothetical protein
MFENILVSGLAGGLIVFIILGSVNLFFFIRKLIRDVDFRKNLLLRIVRVWMAYRVVLIVAVVVGAVFYWYELRPSRIKHECSWTEYRVDAQPADFGVSKEEEARSIDEFDSCAKEYQQKMDSLQKNTWDYINLRAARDMACKERLFYREPSPATPERVERREATEEEYQFCLRDKGL